MEATEGLLARPRDRRGIPHCGTPFGMMTSLFSQSEDLQPYGVRAACLAGREGNLRSQVGVSVALEGVDGVADYYAVDVGYVYATVWGGVFEDLSFETGVAYGFGELLAWAEESGDVLNAHAAF